MVNTPPANWTMPKPAKKMATHKPALVTRYKPLIKDVRMTQHILIHVLASPDYIVAPEPVMPVAQAHLAAANTPHANVVLIINGPAAPAYTAILAPDTMSAEEHGNIVPAANVLQIALNAAPTALMTISPIHAHHHLAATASTVADIAPAAVLAHHQVLLQALQALQALQEVVMNFGAATAAVIIAAAYQLSDMIATATLDIPDANLPEELRYSSTVSVRLSAVMVSVTMVHFMNVNINFSNSINSKKNKASFRRP